MSEQTDIKVPADALAIVIKSDGESECYIPEIDGELHPNQALLFGSMMFFDIYPEHPVIDEIFAWMEKDLKERTEGN